jgi:hypothetical protein
VTKDRKQLTKYMPQTGKLDSDSYNNFMAAVYGDLQYNFTEVDMLEKAIEDYTTLNDANINTLQNEINALNSRIKALRLVLFEGDTTIAITEQFNNKGSLDPDESLYLDRDGTKIPVVEFKAVGTQYDLQMGIGGNVTTTTEETRVVLVAGEQPKITGVKVWHGRWGDMDYENPLGTPDAPADASESMVSWSQYMSIYGWIYGSSRSNKPNVNTSGSNSSVTKISESGIPVEHIKIADEPKYRLPDGSGVLPVNPHETGWCLMELTLDRTIPITGITIDTGNTDKEHRLFKIFCYDANSNFTIPNMGYHMILLKESNHINTEPMYISKIAFYIENHVENDTHYRGIDTYANVDFFSVKEAAKEISVYVPRCGEFHKMWIEEGGQNGKLIGQGTITRYGKNGKIVHIAEVPLEDYKKPYYDTWEIVELNGETEAQAAARFMETLEDGRRYLQTTTDGWRVYTEFDGTYKSTKQNGNPAVKMNGREVKTKDGTVYRFIYCSAVHGSFGEDQVIWW